MNRAKVDVLKQAYEKRLCRFLQHHDGGGLKPDVVFEVESNFLYKFPKRQLWYEKVRGLLVELDFPESALSRLVLARAGDAWPWSVVPAVGALGLGGGLCKAVRDLVGKWASGYFPSVRLACGLFGARHFGS